MEMKIVSSKEMIDIDNSAIYDYKISGLVLMENAGAAVVHTIIKKYPDKKSAAIFVGSGNNGGDGLVIARHLFLSGYKTFIFYIGDKAKASKSNRRNLYICRKMKIPVVFIKDDNGVNRNIDLIKRYDIIIDSILGIGLNSPLKGRYLTLIKELNKLNNKIRIAVDIPTGIYADSPQINSEAFKADLTVTFGALKTAHILSPARSYSGEVIVKNISFPGTLLEKDTLKVNLITKKDFNEFLPVRNRHAYKNDFGNVIAYLGSVGKSGAAILASKSVMESGAGLLTAIIPEEINEVVENNLIEGMTYPIDLDKSDIAFKKCLPFFNKADVILAGCGITADENPEKFLREILSLKGKYIVLDADALNIIAKDISLLKSNNTFILTPHIGEMSRLTGMDKDMILSDPIKIAQDFSLKHRVILVLKSSETIISNDDGVVFVNNKGNEGMATAGSGDVLAGIITGLLAQNVRQNRPVFEAVIAGVYSHALSGDLAYEEKGSYSLTAIDLIKNLYKVFKYDNIT